MAHRCQPAGGFSHDDGKEGPFLCDFIAAGRAFFALYQSAGNYRWLSRATAAADAAAATFAYGAGAGFQASITSLTPAYHPLPDREEIAEFARFAEHLFDITGDSRYPPGPVSSSHLYCNWFAHCRPRAGSSSIRLMTSGGQ
jgi:hypothetical protein